ncbi:hypothetical protein BU16DRAFT_530840 [Lophium mytilinum]|uniref:Uncharacterized protein n=1 Tax=Lophium mytilinum TaxID=390894 RepID=A0A6A6QD31_9PEZI|nr:hypothetical protein BU16DRAFT_530840 [Lophium mytilinum]
MEPARPAIELSHGPPLPDGSSLPCQCLSQSRPTVGTACVEKFPSSPIDHLSSSRRPSSGRDVLTAR